MDGDYFNDLPQVFGVRSVMPAQFFTARERQRARSPEKRLMYAILEDAVSVYCSYREPATRRRRKAFREAQEWFESHDNAWVFSFLRVCEVLELDPDCIRDGVRRKRHAALARQWSALPGASPVTFPAAECA